MDHPIFIISIIYICKLKHIWFESMAGYVSNALSTAVISSSTVLVGSFCCQDWIALNNPKSKTFKSREFGGWQVTWTFKPNLDMAKWNSPSLGSICVRALSCWIIIGLPSKGHFSILGATLLIKYDLIMSFPIKVIGLVSRVPAALCELLLLAGSWVTNRKIPIFPEYDTLTDASNLGHVTADKNMIFVKKNSYTYKFDQDHVLP